MATTKTRMIKNDFWTDTYIEDLEPNEKLLFLYLLTNPLCNICGIYEITEKRVSYETGIQKNEVKDILEKFENDKKIIRENSWVVITNFVKHQSNKSPDVIKGVTRVLESIPTILKQKIEEIGGSIEGLETVYRLSRELDLTKLNLTKLNLTKLNHTQPNAPAESVSEEDVFKIFRKFKKLSPKLTGTETKQIEATKKLIGEYGKEKALLIVDQAIAIQGRQYSPKILTPLDLWEKIGDLQVYLKRKQEDKQNSNVAKI